MDDILEVEVFFSFEEVKDGFIISNSIFIVRQFAGRVAHNDIINSYSIKSQQQNMTINTYRPSAASSIQRKVIRCEFSYNNNA